MGEIENQTPEGAEEFVAPTTNPEEKEGFVDPEMEAHHQDLKAEVGRLRRENDRLDNPRPDFEHPLNRLAGEIRVHEVEESKLYEELARLQHLEEGGHWEHSDKEYHKSYERGINNEIEKMRANQRNVSQKEADVYKEQAQRRVPQVELQQEDEIAERGDSDIELS